MSIKDRNLKPGTQLIGKYHKQSFYCVVVEGAGDKVRYKLSDGREFKSPSAAGMAITGHACDGWMFWSVETATKNSQAENQQEANANVTENTSQTAAESAPAAKPEDVPVPETAPVATEATTAKENSLKTPNQKGVAEGQARWYCAECGESFLAHYSESLPPALRVTKLNFLGLPFNQLASSPPTGACFAMFDRQTLQQKANQQAQAQMVYLVDQGKAEALDTLGEREAAAQIAERYL